MRTRIESRGAIACRRMTFSALAAAAVAMQGACAPTKLLAPPAGWPVEWQHRKLYNTPHAYIYAGDENSARRADELGAMVWKEFEKRTGGKAGKGLLLVNRLGESPVIRDYRTYCDMTARRTAAASGETLSEGQLAQRSEKIEEALKSQGIDPELLLLMTPMSLRTSDLEDLGFAKEVTSGVHWAAVVPSRPLIEYAIRETMRGELQQRGFGPVVQVALYPITNFEERIRNAKARVARQVELFRNQAEQQAGWDSDRRNNESQSYMERKLQEETLPVFTLLTDVVGAVVDPLLPNRADQGGAGSQIEHSKGQDGLEGN